MKNILLLMLLASAASAQTTIPILGGPLSLVQIFLGLNNAQVDAILKNNEDYNQSTYQKQDRIRQVQSEIAEWTSAEALDPMQLGVRYMEIEQLCRQMKDAAINTQKKNMAVLNDYQQGKLKVLDDAMKLMPVISQAQSAGMLGSITSVPYGFTSTGGSWVSTAGFISDGMPGCYSPIRVPTALERTLATSTPAEKLQGNKER